MSQRIAAVFQNGVFRPELPVNLDDGERVLLSVETQNTADDDLADVRDLLDQELMASCRGRGENVPTLEYVESVLSTCAGSMDDRVAEERTERSEVTC